jgi:hypothetical protein
MTWGGPEFVLAIIAISTFGWIASSWIRARHGYPIENEWVGISYKNDVSEESRQVALLADENATLKAQLSRLEERMAVMERIATDPAERTAREIEQLRAEPKGDRA